MTVLAVVDRYAAECSVVAVFVGVADVKPVYFVEHYHFVKSVQEEIYSKHTVLMQ